jgi:hypothetical protein
MQVRFTQATRNLIGYRERLRLRCHVKIILARIAFLTTALIVVILLPSYEESVNLSRCNLILLEPLEKRDKMPSIPQVHEFSGQGICRDKFSTI